MAKWIMVIMAMVLATTTLVACGGSGEDNSLEIKVLKAGESLSGGYQYDISFVPLESSKGLLIIPKPEGIMMPINSKGEVVISFYAENVEELNQNFSNWLQQFKVNLQHEKSIESEKAKKEEGIMKSGEKIIIP